MKKLLVVLLSLCLIFAFAACGETAEETAAEEAQVFTSIPIGEIGYFPIKGVAYGSGEYVLIDTPASIRENCPDDEIARTAILPISSSIAGRIPKGWIWKV